MTDTQNPIHPKLAEALATHPDHIAGMLTDGISRIGWTPNQWGGWDYKTVPLRITRGEGLITLYRFTDWHSKVLEWDARFHYTTPKGVVAAAIAEALTS